LLATPTRANINGRCLPHVDRGRLLFSAIEISVMFVPCGWITIWGPPGVVSDKSAERLSLRRMLNSFSSACWFSATMLGCSGSRPTTVGNFPGCSSPRRSTSPGHTSRGRCRLSSVRKKWTRASNRHLPANEIRAAPCLAALVLQFCHREAADALESTANCGRAF